MSKIEGCGDLGDKLVELVQAKNTDKDGTPDETPSEKPDENQDPEKEKSDVNAVPEQKE